MAATIVFRRRKMTIRQKTIEEVVEMLDKELFGLNRELIDIDAMRAEALAAIKRVNGIKEATLGLLGGEAPSKAMVGVDVEITSADNNGSSHNVVWDNAASEYTVVQQPHSRYAFPKTQAHWAVVYGLVQSGYEDPQSMADKLGWKKQKVRDCLRGLSDLSLVYKPRRAVWAVCTDEDAKHLAKMNGDADYSFSSRQERWESVYRLVVGGYSTSQAISKKLGRNWTIHHASDCLCKLKKAGLVVKLSGNRWVPSSRNVVLS